MKTNEFIDALELLADNFNFKLTNKLWVKKLFEISRSYSYEDIRYGFQFMAKKTSKEWNDDFGYGGKPSFMDWDKAFKIRKKELEESEKSKKQYELANMARIKAIEKTARECFDCEVKREKFITNALNGSQSIPTTK